MRKAYIVKSIDNKFKKLLSKTTFIFLNSHWFLNLEDDYQGVYLIRINTVGDDIEYKIKKYDESEVVTDNLEVATLLVEINEVLGHIDQILFEEYFANEHSLSVEMFSASKAVVDVELDKEDSIKIYLKS